MRRAILFSFVLASALLAAQTPQESPKGSALLVGCVAPAQRDGSLGAKASGVTATPENATMEANNPEPTGRFMLLDAAPEGAASDVKRTTYALRGNENELAKHVGHRVQITGTALLPPANKLEPKAAETAEGIRAVQVTGIKMIGMDCSPKEQK
jgi:hypothetical protein